MKIFRALLVFVFLGSALHANSYLCDPCECDPCECIEPTTCIDECGKGCVFFADWLYWSARKCQLDYALPFDDGVSPDETIGSTKRVCPDYSSGFRIGAHKCCNDLWYGIRYTRFSNETSSSTVDLDGDLAATRVGANEQDTDNGNIEYASAKYEVCLDVIDLEASCPTQWGSCVCVNLLGGVKLAYLDQKIKTHYAESNADREGTQTGNAVDKVDEYVDMDAYGLYFGFDANSLVCGKVSLFGRASLGALVGCFDNRYKLESQPGAQAFALSTNLKDGCNRLITNFDLSLGLAYDFCGPCSSNWFVKLGYEFSHWMNTSDFIRLNENNNGNENHIYNATDSIGFDGLFLSFEGTF